MNAQVPSIAFVGDICPGDHYFSLGHGTGSLSSRARSRAFAALRPVFQANRAVFANLEGVLSKHESDDAAFSTRAFRGDPSWAETLRESGISVVSVANNHALQYGVTGFRDTVSACNDAGLKVAGLCDSVGDPTPVEIALGMQRCHLIAVSLIDDARHSGTTSYAFADVKRLPAQVRELSGHGKTPTIVSVHMGREGALGIDPGITALANEVFAAGATAIVAHHSHLFGSVVQLPNKVLCTGLGDCLFGLFWHPALVTSAVVSLEISDQNSRLLGITPFKLTPDFRLNLLPKADLQAFLTDRIYRANSLEAFDANDSRPLRPISFLQTRKLIWFLSHLHKGLTRDKMRFLYRKAVARYQATT